MHLGSSLDCLGNFKILGIFGVLRLNSEPRNRVKNRSRAGTSIRKLLQMLLVLMSDHKNALGIEFGSILTTFDFLIFGVLTLISEPGSSAFWPN